MINFRNVVVGSPNTNIEEWPKLGDGCGKTSTSKPKNRDSIRKNCEARAVQDSSHFPVLNQVLSSKQRKDERPKSAPVQSVKRAKKKIKKSTPLRVDICDIIQASALKKKQKSDIAILKKDSKLKKKVIGGNLLDSDQPRRHKGKVRPWKPREQSKTKKLICSSRKIRLPRFLFPREVLKFKENFGAALKQGSVDVEELVDGLREVSLEGEKSIKGEGSKEEVANRIAKSIIHNKKFRSYCSNIVTQELKKHASDLIVMLRKFQDRMHAKDEIKAHAKRRYVCGFNESKKFLLAEKIKLLLVATNLEMEEGLPSMTILKHLVDAAAEKDVPVIYCGLGENIGYWSLKKTKISVLGVINYEGANEVHSNLIRSWTYCKEEYDKLVKKITDLSLSKTGVSDVVAEKEVEDEIKDVILRKLKE